jgi:SulP family sulfate permease
MRKSLLMARAVRKFLQALGAGVLGVTLGTARISSKVPGALIGIVGAGVAVAALHLQNRGVTTLGALSVTLPRLALPPLPGTREIGQLVPLAFVVAMVCIMQTSAVASTFPSEKEKPADVSRDFCRCRRR